MNKDFRANLLQLKYLAFTLAETLIVMGIIGVVAALTLPNLNSSTGEKEKVTKVKKIYSNLEDAVGRAQAVYGPLDEWCVNYSGECRDRMFERVTEFMKTSKVCNTVNSCPDLLFESAKNTGGGPNSYYTKHAVILADGSALGIEVQNNSTIKTIKFIVDIDGINKGANTDGIDVFQLFFTKDGGRNYSYSTNESFYVYRDNNGSFYPSYAADWILNFDNMDYLKTTDGTTCPDGKTKLTWGGNHSCK